MRRASATPSSGPGIGHVYSREHERDIGSLAEDGKGLFGVCCRNRREASAYNLAGHARTKIAVGLDHKNSASWQRLKVVLSQGYSLRESRVAARSVLIAL